MLEPILSTPLSIKLKASARVLIPPNAFIFVLGAAALINSISFEDAPREPRPVEVLMKSALPISQISLILLISESVKREVSIITFKILSSIIFLLEEIISS